MVIFSSQASATAGPCRPLNRTAVYSDLPCF